MKPEVWIIVCAIIVGLLVRFTKDDATSIPARLRPSVALLLGVATSALGRAQLGMDWRSALFYGAMGSFTSIAGHEIIIEGIRKGDEFKLPGLAAKAKAKKRVRASRPREAKGNRA